MMDLRLNTLLALNYGIHETVGSDAMPVTLPQAQQVLPQAMAFQGALDDLLAAKGTDAQLLAWASPQLGAQELLTASGFSDTMAHAAKSLSEAVKTASSPEDAACLRRGARLVNEHSNLWAEAANTRKALLQG